MANGIGLRQASAVPIHPSAIVHAEARLHPTVEVGPLAVIDAHVDLGEGCRVGPHVHLTGHTTIGRRNVFHAGCVIGDDPQDLKFKGGASRLRIGDDNVFREHVTVHRANSAAEDTVIGSGGLFMAGAHVGHNSRIGDRVILANGALLGGHVTVEDRAFISGNCLVHQFVRVGTLALMQGGSAISKDLPPYCISRGDNGISGLNVVGLRRAGVPPEARLELRKIFHALFRTRHRWTEAVRLAGLEVRSDWGRALMTFLADSRRGILKTRGTSGDRTETD
ncbi:MAG: acyl-ACP--UDP-N-acetylglucosamine O-acyltransferase [Verrucomicrobiales bacterium]|nr:acyl-ACP--UDP-N-acetylglucosamine O-acyltransferase [Verrucomicrobiales bacterium]